MTAPHASLPLHGLPSLHELGLRVQENLQFASQPVPAPFCMPKSHCSLALASTTPSPQAVALHAPPMQMRPLPQLVPLASGTPAVHFCPAWPLTMTALHASTPLHAFPSLHEFGLAMQENLQLASQPVPAPFCMPKSQSSPTSLAPLPQMAFWPTHAPALQTRFTPHICPSF